jgi:hypothetical protein
MFPQAGRTGVSKVAAAVASRPVMAAGWRCAARVMALRGGARKVSRFGQRGRSASRCERKQDGYDTGARPGRAERGG